MLCNFKIAESANYSWNFWCVKCGTCEHLLCFSVSIVDNECVLVCVYVFVCVREGEFRK